MFRRFLQNGLGVKQLRRHGHDLFRKLIKDTEGATAIEYGLIAALIAVAAITAMGALGNSLKNTFGSFRPS
jgi:pilus assembly protein Flp/PilA